MAVGNTHWLRGSGLTNPASPPFAATMGLAGFSNPSRLPFAANMGLEGFAREPPTPQAPYIFRWGFGVRDWRTPEASFSVRTKVYSPAPKYDNSKTCILMEQSQNKDGTMKCRQVHSNFHCVSWCLLEFSGTPCAFIHIYVRT